MPELPEVETVVRGLRDCILNREIEKIESHYPTTVTNHTKIKSLPSLGRILSIDRRGKYIVINTDAGFVILVHLRMTGKLVFDGLCSITGTHVRATFHLKGNNKLCFDDTRTFGKIKIFRQGDSIPDIEKLGVEPLSYLLTSEYLKEKWGNRNAPVKSLMLQQEVIAGLGNIYACEILYRSGVSPLTPGKKLSQKVLDKIVVQTREVMQEAISMNGTSVSDFRRVDEKTGEFQNFLRVYQKKECPKGHTLRIVRIAGRSTYFCPVCQR
ncbi:MAG TPA: bifunctional DNA-formamidopyrimidine glycosylase/DNA-(apurinic or apyrimidinic site) lyase [Candidatus Cloacimonadota bacterium]|nr:bifunctional DNA-formamidopyrimidine glycosylase/DNA-(apurinic or apyrimidinic site) lyase [Candidatus Cloacimonadota bacterium]HPT71387.1 bifunctional DNA-formamidopyrimidine glycosylase/DNA-(apurinic or apyrimidinic site) lyase [Candidatus Cloacimonadota bacterium]